MEKVFIVPKSHFNTMQLLLNYQLTENEKLVFRVTNIIRSRFKFDYVQFKNKLIVWIKRMDLNMGWKDKLTVKFYSSLFVDNFKYDVVYRWVNPNVFNNIITFEMRNPILKKSLQNPQRYRDNGELKYSIRSLMKFCKKNLGKIYIIARGKPPSWLKPDQEKIIWVEEDILFRKIEQVWNIKITERHSEICKLALQWLPHLREHFVLMDDDYFIMKKPIFFTANRYPICKFNWPGVLHHPIPFTKKIYMRNIKKLSLKYVKLITQTKERRRSDPFKIFQIKGRIRIDYIYSPKLISIPQRAYPRNFNRLQPYGYPAPFSKERSKYDIIVTWSWIAEMANYRQTKQESTVKDIRIFFESIDSLNPTFLCVNDDWNEYDIKKYNKCIEIFHQFLSNKFPTPTIWEN